MASALEHTATVDELYRLPDDENRYELTRGRLVSEPPVGARHGRVVMRIGSLLDTWARGIGIGVVVAGDVGFVLARDPDTVRAPDVAFVRTHRYPAPDAERGAIVGPPDLAVEVLSPGDRPGRVRAKIDDYRDAGTALVWIVDADAQEVRAYPKTGSVCVFGWSDTLVAPDVLPGFAAAVADVFRLV